MAKATKRNDPISDQLEGGVPYGLSLPSPQRISLYVQEHAGLEEVTVGDVVKIMVTARVTDIDEDGRHGLELTKIEFGNQAEKMDKAKGEVIMLGTLSEDSLDAMMNGELE